MSSSNDDWSWRIGVITFSIVTYIASWSAMFLAYVSNYPPFKARQLNVLAISLISGFFWQFGAMNTLDIFQHAPPFHACYFLYTWSYVVLGVTSTFTLMEYRLLRLYYIAIKRVDASGIAFWSLLFAPMMVAVLHACAPGAIPSLMTISSEFDPGLGRLGCHYNDDMYLYSLFIIPFCLGVVIGCLIFKLRGIKKAFNEFREMKVNVVVCFVLFFGDVVLVGTGGKYYQPWRSVLISFCNIGGSLSMFWSVMFPPLYGYLFKREEYLKQFQRSLKNDKMDTREKKSIISKQRPSVLEPHAKRPSDVDAKQSNPRVMESNGVGLARISMHSHS